MTRLRLLGCSYTKNKLDIILIHTNPEILDELSERLRLEGIPHRAGTLCPLSTVHGSS